MCKCKETFLGLTLEVGKTYLNKNGDKVKILRKSPFSYLGEDEKGDYYHYFSNGECKTGHSYRLIYEMKPKYTTVEGHEIVRDGVYETRDGTKATILGFYSNNESMVGFVTQSSESGNFWSNTGFCWNHRKSPLDIMRPWVDKKPTDIIETGTYKKQRDCTYIYSQDKVDICC